MINSKRIELIIVMLKHRALDKWESIKSLIHPFVYKGIVSKINLLIIIFLQQQKLKCKK
jgi:hypothetical protein